MAGLKRPEAEEKQHSSAEAPQAVFWLPQMRFAPALACALVLVLAVGGWIGYQSYQEHEQRVRTAERQRKVEEQLAKREAILALRITSEKLNHVLRKVNGALPMDVKIRRLRL